MLLKTLVATLLVSLTTAADLKLTMRQALDDMETYFHSKGRGNPGTNGKFDDKYYDKLVQCFNSGNDTKLLKAQEAAWQGMATYYQSNGTTSDRWNISDTYGECINDDQKNTTRCPLSQFAEWLQGNNSMMGDIMIYEPCNYASNIAYYHSTTKICDYPDWTVSPTMVNNFKRAFATLTSGSANMHGAHTYVGYAYDNQFIAVIAYLAHQASVEHLNPNSTSLHELQSTPRSMSTQAVIEEITDMHYLNPVEDWPYILMTNPFPHEYYRVFGAIISTSMAMMFPFFIARTLVMLLASVLLPTEDKDFLKNEYLPILGESIKDLHIPFSERAKVGGMFAGFIVKIVFAFLYQEQFVKLPGFKTDFMIALGGENIATITGIANMLTGFPQTDLDVNTSHNVYPGSKWCNVHSSHSIWHEASANGLLDLVFITNHINTITKKYNHRHTWQNYWFVNNQY